MNSLRVLVAVVVGLSTATLFAAQFNFTAQTRQIDFNAHAASLSSGSVDNVQTLSAPDFSDFNQSISGIATAFEGGSTVGARANATSTQNSHLGGSFIGANGTIVGSTFRSLSLGTSATVSGNSAFSTTFTLSDAADVELQYQLFVDRTLPAFAATSSVSATLSLVGGSTNLTAAASLASVDTTKTITFNQVLSLTPGTYTFSVATSGNAATQGILTQADGRFQGSYSSSLQIIVPEPSSIALLLLGACGLWRFRAASKQASLARVIVSG